MATLFSVHGDSKPTPTASGKARAPALLDLFCGAGGAAAGYRLAGFHVTGVDVRAQPRYPCTFRQGDALELELEYLRSFDAIHASPPCQAHIRGMRAVNRALGRSETHTDLIAPTRELLRAAGVPYVIENVEGAPLDNPVKLCGSSFNLSVRRHRFFECSFPLLVPPCDHSRQNGDHWTGWAPNGKRRRSRVVQVYGRGGERSEWAAAMGITWMTQMELCEAIPPAYTEFIGSALREHLHYRQRELLTREREIVTYGTI